MPSIEGEGDRLDPAGRVGRGIDLPHQELAASLGTELAQALVTVDGSDELGPDASQQQAAFFERQVGQAHRVDREAAALQLERQLGDEQASLADDGAAGAHWMTQQEQLFPVGRPEERVLEDGGVGNVGQYLQKVAPQQQPQPARPQGVSDWHPR